MKEFSKKKVGIIGLGKRFKNVYRQILEDLDCNLYVWNRTKEKTLKYLNVKNYTVCDSLEDIKNANLDICLSFIPGESNFNLLGELDLNCNLLIETPVLDQRWINKSKIGVLEQWPFLPIEQFKEIIYKSNIIERPYMVFNDGRSFDYHAIAQLRSYTGFKKPKSFFGRIQNIELEKGHLNKNSVVNKNDNWLHGFVELEGDVTLMHSFTYDCKMSLIKPYQMLRASSRNGSIVSGRSKEMDNDFELFEIRSVDNQQKVIIHDVQKTLNKNKNIDTISIVANDKNIFWKNKYPDFNNQQIAIADLLSEALKNNLYSPLQSYLDYLTIVGMKQSAANKNIVRL